MCHFFAVLCIEQVNYAKLLYVLLFLVPINGKIFTTHLPVAGKNVWIFVIHNSQENEFIIIQTLNFLEATETVAW